MRRIQEKQPDRAPSLESATTEDTCQRVYGLVATATQTALFTAASFRTWRGSQASVAQGPTRPLVSHQRQRCDPQRGNSIPLKRISGYRAPL